MSLMKLRIKVISIIITITGILIISGCNSGSKKQSVSSSVQQIVLKKDLEISAINDSLLVGGFYTMAADARGRIYALDAQQVKIWVFGPNGHFLDTLGRKGKGPGEFTSLYAEPVISGDTLFVLDPQARRITLFRTSVDTLLKSINIPPSGSKKATITDRGFPRQLFVTRNGPIGVIVESFMLKKRDYGNSSELAVLLLNRNGTWRNQKLIDYSGNRYVTIRSANGFVMLSMKCTVRGFLKYGGGYIFAARNDSSFVERYDIDGKRQLFTKIDAPAYPLTFSQVDSLAGTQNIKNIETSLRKEKFRKAWPYFQDMVADDAGNLWVEITAQGKKEKPWWIYDKSGRKRWVTSLPSDVSIKEISNHEIYAVRQSKDGATAIERYLVPGNL